MNRRTGAGRLARAERQAEAADLAARGLGYRDIATALGCSTSTAHALVRDAAAAVPAASVETLRAAESERLADLDRALAPAVEAGDTAAVAVAVRISARRSALYGLDQAVRADTNAGVTTVVFHSALMPERLRQPELPPAVVQPDDSLTWPPFGV